MRLRLRIERNGLPTTQTLWPVKDARATIAQLLQSIDDILPLESDTWGLDDYSVSVSGYECLHYHEIRAVCRDEDEVVVRPLQWADLKARKLTGRDQITSDGRHLLDGIPFGRPAVRAPVRPGIAIPPRKRRKLVHEDEEEEDASPAQLMLEDVPGRLSDSDDEDDDEEDFDAGFSFSEGTTSDEDSEDVSSDDDSSSSEDDTSDTSDSESDDDSWDGFPSSEPTSLSERKAAKLPNGLPQAEAAAKPSKTSKRRHEGDAEDDIRPSKTIQKGTLSTPVDARVDAGLPFEGTPETKARNARRRSSNRLKKLKQLGKLPADATLAMMYEWDKKLTEPEPTGEVEDQASVEAPTQDVARMNTPPLQTAPTTQTDDAVLGAPMSPNTGLDPMLENENASPVVVAKKKKKKKTKSKDGPDHDEMETKRQQLLLDIQSGGVDVTADASSIVPSSHDTSRQQQPQLRTPTIPPEIDSTDASMDKSIGTPAGSSTPRARLDLAGSKRLVFGSLGVRVPKTQEEKDALQQKLATRAKLNANSHQSDSPLTNGTTVPEKTDVDQTEVNPAEEEEDESWRAKIHLSAVECCDEGVENLSTPPFPFYQRWDPQQRKKKVSKRVAGTYMENAGGKKRKRGKASPEFVETYDKYNINGEGDALDYDDEGGEEYEEYWEDGALLDEGEMEEVAEEEDGFPPLPFDIDSLPVLQKGDCQQGDFITFPELACDETTSWQPKTLTRTARIDGWTADGNEPMGPGEGPKEALWVLCMANRDRVAKNFDDEGNRVYSKFEMPDADEEPVDEPGTRTVKWDELGVVRLVLRPEVDGHGE